MPHAGPGANGQSRPLRLAQRPNSRVSVGGVGTSSARSVGGVGTSSAKLAKPPTRPVTPTMLGISRIELLAEPHERYKLAL